MENMFIAQDYNLYKDEEHKTWEILCKKAKKLRNDMVSAEYLTGFNNLCFNEAGIVRINEMSKRLESLSGWTLIPVKGLIPTKDFFYLLIKKVYPITISIRKMSEIDFSEQPDIFHDVFGHVPLLTSEKFTKFLTAYSIIALKYINNSRAIDLLGRLYWFTYEMGIIKEKGKYKPYGGALITSAEEIRNLCNENIPKHPFDLDKIFKTPYNSFKLQKEYFVVDSFDELFDSISNLESKLIEHLLLPEYDNVLRNFPLNESIGKKFSNVIGFLNDVQFNFPNAISFVAGQPDESFFGVEKLLSKFNVFVDHVSDKTGISKEKVINSIGQYGRTKGIVNDITAQYLLNDENIAVKGDDVLITAGAQEAFSIIVSTICNRETDVVLVEDPSYVGLTSFAKVFNYNIEGVQTDEDGICINDLRDKIIRINRAGKKVKLLYVIPDYQNPSGSCMPIGNRLKLLEFAQKYNFLIIEDGVYNSFTYLQKRNPTIKSLDRFKRVVYVTSFSKLLFPGLRIGLIAAEQQIETETGETVPLIDEMVKVKAQLTNNTSAISQAILGGILLDMDHSLSVWNQPKFESYKKKRDKMIASLYKHIKNNGEEWSYKITWTEPDGGFFIKMSVPFVVDKDSLLECAYRYNVLFCPMQYFYINEDGTHEIRLTFSNLSLDAIETGIMRLAAYLKGKIMLNGSGLPGEVDHDLSYSHSR